jgi:hypothetical protein
MEPLAVVLTGAGLQVRLRSSSWRWREGVMPPRQRRLPSPVIVDRRYPGAYWANIAIRRGLPGAVAVRAGGAWGGPW